MRGAQASDSFDLCISHFGHFAFRMFRISHVSHFAARNRTFRISRREIGHFAFRGAKPDTLHFAARNRTLRDDQVSD